jgi:hypothetical protein
MAKGRGSIVERAEIAVDRWPHLIYFGGSRVGTHGLELGRQALYQFSHSASPKGSFLKKVWVG